MLCACPCVSNHMDMKTNFGTSGPCLPPCHPECCSCYCARVRRRTAPSSSLFLRRLPPAGRRRRAPRTGPGPPPRPQQNPRLPSPSPPYRVPNARAYLGARAATLIARAAPAPSIAAAAIPAVPRFGGGPALNAPGRPGFSSFPDISLTFRSTSRAARAAAATQCDRTPGLSLRASERCEPGSKRHRPSQCCGARQ